MSGAVKAGPGSLGLVGDLAWVYPDAILREFIEIAAPDTPHGAK